MKGVDRAGQAAESGDDGRPEAGGMLAGLSVQELRAFIIRMARAGGASRAALMKAMRVSRAQFYVDAKVPIPGLPDDAGD